MNELSLFSGAGGGLLGTMLLGFRSIGYVEWDDYCQRVLAIRIKDGILPDAPIFGDIKTFIDDGYAASYTGLVDVLTAGFPCQPFSVAGKQKGANDERNMWPSTATVIGIVKPRFVLLENVPGIRSYLPVVVRDLRRLGYEVQRPLILGADDVGAPHRRKRVWIMAYTREVRTGDFSGEIGTDRGRGIGRDEPPFRQTHGEDGTDRVDATGGTENNVAHSPQRQDDGRERRDLDGTTGDREGIDTPAYFGGEDVADAEGITIRPGLCPNEPGRIGRGRSCDGGCEEMADSSRLLKGRQEQRPERERVRLCGESWWASDPADTICLYGDDAGHGTGQVCGECESSEICGLSRWGLKSRVGRVVNGCPHRIHRLKALGNMQVASVVATAWRLLLGGIR